MKTLPSTVPAKRTADHVADLAPGCRTTSAVGSGPTSGIHISTPKPMKQACWRACSGCCSSGRLVEGRDVPDVEVDRPERQRHQRMGQDAAASRASRSRAAAGAAGRSGRARSAAPPCPPSAGAGPCGRARARSPMCAERRDEATAISSRARGEAGDAPGRDGPALLRQGRRAKRVGGRDQGERRASWSGSKRQPAADVRELRPPTSAAPTAAAGAPCRYSQSMRRKKVASAATHSAISRQGQRVAERQCELGHVLEVHAVDAGDEGRDGDDRRRPRRSS